MAQLGQMQERLAKAQEEMESRVAVGTAGGGAVSVEITGAYRVKSLKIDPEVVDADDLGMLEDLVTAAVNEALTQVQSFQAENLAGLTGGLNLPGLPGAGGPSAGGPPLNRAARRAGKR
jgi:DNA-binding YbaB/EbfC family protein